VPIILLITVIIMTARPSIMTAVRGRILDVTGGATDATTLKPVKIGNRIALSSKIWGDPSYSGNFGVSASADRDIRTVRQSRQTSHYNPLFLKKLGMQRR
jgi:hypothetical protein